MRRRAAVGHRPVGDAERFQALRVARAARCPASMRLGGDPGTLQQLLARLLAPVRRLGHRSPAGRRSRRGTGSTRLPSFACASAPSASSAERVHRQLDALRSRRGDPLHLGRGNPAGADRVALAIGRARPRWRRCGRRRTRRRRDIAGRPPARPSRRFPGCAGSGAGRTAPRTVTSSWAWKAKASSRVSSGAGSRRLTRNTETDRRPLGQAALGAVAGDRADGEGDFQPVAAVDLGLAGSLGGFGNFQLDLLDPLGALPLRAVAVAVGRLAELVIAPADARP